jgi:hypothetical protein
MTTTAATVEQLLAELAGATTTWGIEYRNRAVDAPDAYNQARNLYLAAIAEWGAGDELTSEAVRYWILTCDATPGRRMWPGVRSELIRTHLLDDLCPRHLTELHQPPDGEAYCTRCEDEAR